MNISVDISLYPLDADYKPPIRAFIRRLRAHAGLTVVSNQMSTQITGEYAAVMNALDTCMREVMEQPGRMVFAARYLNTALPIGEPPDLT